MKKFIAYSTVMMITINLITPLLSAQTPPVNQTLTRNPQFFCGYCHVLTYPKIIKKSYKSWKKGKHGEKEISCEECHYPPEKLAVKIPEHKKIPHDEKAAAGKKASEREFMQTQLEVLARQITMLGMEESVVRTSSRIDDQSCTTSNCHPTSGKGEKAEYWDKKLKFTEYERPDKTKAVISFTHKKHFDKKKWVAGQQLHCTTCHHRETEQKHFEVSKQSCALCHFKNAPFAEERAKCSLCHEMPEESIIQLVKAGKSGEPPEEGAINHKKLEEKNVPCASCHLQVVRGNGAVNQGKCLNCHEKSQSIMKDWDNQLIVHQEHVAAQTADCFNCHETIQHQLESKDYDHIDAALADCRECHAKPHLQQRQLLAGLGGHGMEKAYPVNHYAVNVNCAGCHDKESHDEKGRAIKIATAENCVSCHSEKERGLIEQWKGDVADFFMEARDMEKEALEALEAAKGKLSEATFQQAMALFQNGQENLRIVDSGGGVHNKKFSVSLLDVAIIHFEDVMDMVKAD